MSFERSWIEDYLPAIRANEIAHYTSIGTLPKLIPEGAVGWASAWASPVQFLNDRKELGHGLDMLRLVAERSFVRSLRIRVQIDSLISSFGSISTDAYQLSFSGAPDELGQWRGYGDGGMGCSVVTERAQVHAVADVAGWVIYEPEAQERFAESVLNRLATMTDDSMIEKVIVAAACFMKHHGFEQEQEYRLICFPEPTLVRFREAGQRLIPYIDCLKGKQALPVNRVVIGPGWQIGGLSMSEQTRHHVVQGIQRLLDIRTVPASPTPSVIPYDPR